jgi:hypothetical protein
MPIIHNSSNRYGLNKPISANKNPIEKLNQYNDADGLKNISSSKTSHSSNSNSSSSSYSSIIQSNSQPIKKNNPYNLEPIAINSSFTESLKNSQTQVPNLFDENKKRISLLLTKK